MKRVGSVPMKCMYCDTPLPEEARFCISCGTLVTRCPVCTAQVVNEAKFCGNCGTDLREHDFNPNTVARSARTTHPILDADIEQHFIAELQEGDMAILYRPNRPAQRYRIGQGDNTIGAGPKNDIVVADPAISWNHAVLMCREGHLHIQDTASTNGTYVNGVEVERPICIGHGDIVRLADMDFAVWVAPSARSEVVTSM